MERNLNIEKLKYQENKFAYNLALIAFLLNQVYLVAVLNNMSKNYHIGIEIFINLAMYMILFLGMERVKNHHKAWSICFIVLGALFFVRVFYLPMMIIRTSNELLAIGDANGILVAADLKKAAIIAIVTIIAAGILIIISGLHGYSQSTKIKNYYEKIELN